LYPASAARDVFGKVVFFPKPGKKVNTYGYIPDYVSIAWRGSAFQA
jgi:hypothetical protein